MKKTKKIISMVLVLMLLFGCVSVLPVSAAETDANCPVDAANFFEFENSLNWENVYYYAYNMDDGSLTGEWPGITAEPYTNAQGQTRYIIDVPAGAEAIYINDGMDRTIEITDFNPMGGGYYLSETETETDVFGSTNYKPIPLAEKYPQEIESRCIIGDTDSNFDININDVTALQKHLARSSVPADFNVTAGDVDQDGDTNIDDATMIQYHIAGKYHKNSYCGFVLRGDRRYGNVHFDFSDRLGWGEISIIARDEDNNVLPGTDVKQGSWGTCSLTVPGDTYTLTVISEDGTKSTAPSTNWHSGFGMTYVAWDKANNKYVLSTLTWGGLAPQFYFVNSLGWEHVYLVSYDKFGNVEDSKELYKSDDNRYFATVSAYASNVYILGDNGEETDRITDYYCVPGEEEVYYLDRTKTTVNEKGETVYVPLKASDKEITSTFKFANTLNWTDVHVYAWTDDGKPCGSEWPGEELVEYTLDGFGMEIFTVNVPKDAAGIVISGAEGQTADIYNFFPANGGYYLTKQDVAPDSTTGQTVYIPIEWEAPEWEDK